MGEFTSDVTAWSGSSSVRSSRTDSRLDSLSRAARDEGVTRPTYVVVLAAGEGTRMRSARPKPLHHLCGRPMVLYVLDAGAHKDVRATVVVVGHGATWVEKA